MLLDIFDPKAPPKPIGIDLGTTHSVVAHVRDGRAVAVTTCDGGPLLPSVVHYDERGGVRVGRAARAYLDREPQRTIASVKRFMGRGSGDAQTLELGSYSFAKPLSEQDAKVVHFDLGDRSVTPVEVSAEILRNLKQSAAEQLRAVGGAVITVPAYFDDAQRQATRDAARLANLEVLRLLNEPTAAALAYGLGELAAGTFAVYDLGGGTFDITILHLDDGVFHVKSTGGDSALGGDDMDRAIAERFLRAIGFEQPAEAPKSVIALALSSARDIKHQLTEADVASIELPRRGGGDTNVRLTRAELDTSIAPLLERTGRAVRRALRDAKLEPADLDGVILVGGATRMPRVRSYVAELFGREALCEIDPDLVVAYGAALQADQLSRGTGETLLLDVLPLSLGVETMGGAVDRILPRNTTIPVSAKTAFTTYADNQTGFELHIVQGERELAKDCRSLARFTLRGIPALPAGQARLEISFHVDENSLLRVHARELSTGIEQEVEVKPTYGLTDEQVEQMLEDALDHGEEDLEQRRLAEARVEGSRVLHATRQALERDGDLLEPTERARVESAMAELDRAIESRAIDSRAIDSHAIDSHAIEPNRDPVNASRIQALTQTLDAATHAWAGRRMDRAFQSALAGQNVKAVAVSVEHARGVDAHVKDHERGGQ